MNNIATAFLPPACYFLAFFLNAFFSFGTFNKRNNSDLNVKWLSQSLQLDREKFSAEIKWHSLAFRFALPLSTISPCSSMPSHLSCYQMQTYRYFAHICWWRMTAWDWDVQAMSQFPAPLTENLDSHVVTYCNVSFLYKFLFFFFFIYLCSVFY